MLTSSKIKEKEIFDISIRSANAQEKKVYIFELGQMWDFLSIKESEKIRQTFLGNWVHVQQITNDSTIPEFSENSDFVNTLMKFRFIPTDIFSIKKEILIFDDIVAIYNHEEILIIEDIDFAHAQKQLFENIWKEWISPKVDFPYIPNHSFYNSVDVNINGIQMIVWPDAESPDSYTWYTKDMLQDYLKSIIESDSDYYQNSSYMIVFIWSLDWVKMTDIWKFMENPVDDRSWPLSDARVYKDTELCTDIWLSSWNTLLVLWYEEKLRRQSSSLIEYLDGPGPNLPLEVLNKLNFFDYNNSK